jgi:two-component system, OmpR family, sensor histidine kinase MtrB
LSPDETHETQTTRGSADTSTAAKSAEPMPAESIPAEPLPAESTLAEPILAESMLPEPMDFAEAHGRQAATEVTEVPEVVSAGAGVPVDALAVLGAVLDFDLDDPLDTPATVESIEGSAKPVAKTKASVGEASVVGEIAAGAGAGAAAPAAAAGVGGGSMPPEYVDRSAVLDRPERLKSAKLPWKMPARFARLSLGLRSRAALALGLGALVISIAVAMLTYIVARRSLVEDRRSVIQQLVFADAVEAQRAIASKVEISSVLKSQIRSDFQSLIVQNNKPYTSNEKISLTDDVPAELRDKTRGAVGEIKYHYQVTRRNGRSTMVIGVPLPVVNAEFYGIASLRDVEKRLRNLAQTLTAAALLTSIGSALVGQGVSRRVLRPLASVAAAAGGISSGRLDTRLELTGDADLDPLLSSFNEMASSLQSRIEREVRFASDVSHELRTPLTALVTAARLLDGRRDELGERGQKTLDVLVTQTTHFERLVLDLLEMSRFDAGAATLHAEMVNLPDLLRQIVDLNESQAQVMNDSLDPIEVGLDKRRVERMVANLLQNAANYADGAVDVVVSQVSGPAGERRVRISVGDHGPGVPPDEQDAIFERFRRGQSHMRGTPAQKGTGLGLSLVRAHANLHSGTVWVEDNPGGGARFVLDIAELEVSE